MSNPLKRVREEAQPDVEDVPNKKQKISENNILDYLHDELVQHVLVFVPHRNVGRLRSVSKLFNNIIQSQEYWRRKSIEEWGADNVMPERCALSLSASSDALLSNNEYLIPIIKDGSKTLIHWKQYFHARTKLRTFIDELEIYFTEFEELDFNNVSELKLADIDRVLYYIEGYEWDGDDAIAWPEGNKYQNKFGRAMFDCTAEILLLCINNEKWDLVERITRNIPPMFDLAGSFINHEAVCVKLLDICEALQDRATFVVPYFHKATTCFKVLKDVTEFTKRVYRRLVEQQIKMGLLTCYPKGDKPTKHMHFRYPQKSFQSILLNKLFPSVEDLVEILLDVVSKVYYDPKSDWRSRASALATLRTVSLLNEDKLAYSFFEFGIDAIKSDNSEVLYAGLVLLYETAIYCSDIRERISDEQAACLVEIVAREIRNQTIEHGLFLVEMLTEFLQHQKSQCVNELQFDTLNRSITWLLQRPGVINTGIMEFRALNKIVDLGTIFRSRMRKPLGFYKHALFAMAMSPELKADLITNEEILAVYYKLLKDVVEDSDQEGEELINQVLENSIGFEVGHPQFFALCGNMAYKNHFSTGDNQEQLASIIKAMLAVFSDQINLYGQSLYPDTMPQEEVPSDIPNSLDQFLQVTKSVVLDKEFAIDRTDLAELFNFEASPEPQEAAETNSPYVVKVNFLDAYENEFDRVAIRAELAMHFCTVGIENLTEIAVKMKKDFLPYAQTTLHILLALFRLEVPPKYHVILGISELFEILVNELGDYDKMQYARIMTHRLDILRTHYGDTMKAQGLTNSLNHLYVMCGPLQVRNPYVTSAVVRSMLDFFMDLEMAPEENKWPKVLPEMVRMFVLGHPRRAYAAFLESRLKDNASLWKALETNSAIKGSVFNGLSYLVIFFGLEFALNILNAPLPDQEVLRKLRDSAFQYYMENKAMLGDSPRVFLELMLVLSSAALVNPDILEFRFFSTFLFKMKIITDALEALTQDEEVKQRYGTGSDEFDKFIVDILTAPGGFTAWYWSKVCLHYATIRVFSSAEDGKDKPPE